jgi:hypothetical protein
MKAHTLRERIETETGLSVREGFDTHELAGLFNRYRPEGVGLERLLSGDGVEGEVRARIKRVFDVTAPGADPGDWYFVIRRHESLDRAAAIKVARDYLLSMQRLAEFIGDTEVRDALSALKVESHPPAAVAEDDDVPVMLYESFTAFLPSFARDGREILLLEEALYSMANDYSLMAYMLAPVIPLGGEARGALDPYFDVWRYGITLKFFAGGIVSVGLPEPVLLRNL